MKRLVVIWEDLFCDAGIQRKIRMLSGSASGHDKVGNAIVCASLLTFYHFIKLHVVAAEIPLFRDDIGCQVKASVKKTVVQQRRIFRFIYDLCKSILRKLIFFIFHQVSVGAEYESSSHT